MRESRKHNKLGKHGSPNEHSKPEKHGKQSERGETITEVLVASVLLIVVSLATAVALTSMVHADYVIKQRQGAAGVAQRETEKLARLDYAALSMTSTPQSSSDPLSPLNRVNGSNFRAENGQMEPMVVGGTGAAVDPGPTLVTAPNFKANVYRFVTWVNAPNTSDCIQSCGSTQDYKRVTVIVRVVSGTLSGVSKYTAVSTLRINPLMGPDGVLTQPNDPSPTQAHNNFYLYDTRASSCVSNAYAAPSSDHVTHDTRGFCGSQNNDYPDLMGISPPPNPVDPLLPPLYNYSTDVSGSYVGGAAMLGATNCTLSSLSKTEVHNWITDPISTSVYKLSGKVSFDFWSATAHGASSGGTICVWLYDNVVTNGAPTNTLIASSSYALAFWPALPTNTSFTFSHSPYDLPAGHRLRFVVSVSSQSTDALQIVYDYPTAASFLQVRTTTPLTQ